eukprot:7753131-Pyramimonas_sp.AAC.1
MLLPRPILPSLPASCPSCPPGPPALLVSTDSAHASAWPVPRSGRGRALTQRSGRLCDGTAADGGP